MSTKSCCSLGLSPAKLRSTPPTVNASAPVAAPFIKSRRSTGVTISSLVGAVRSALPTMTMAARRAARTLPVHRPQEPGNVRQHKIAAKKGVGVAETWQREKCCVRYSSGKLFVRWIHRVGLPRKHQARHGHLREDRQKARAGQTLSSIGDERLHIVRH